MHSRDDDPLAQTLGILGLAASLLVFVVLLLSCAATIFAGHPAQGATGVIVFGPCATWCAQSLWRRLLAA